MPQSSTLNLCLVWQSLCVSVHGGGHPVRRAGHLVVDAGLALLSARVARGHNADQVPRVLVLHHQGAARIALKQKQNLNKAGFTLK